jgi:hypothetical protein
MTSKTKANGANANKAFAVEEHSKFETFRPDEINDKLDEVNKVNNDLRETG